MEKMQKFSTVLPALSPYHRYYYYYYNCQNTVNRQWHCTRTTYGV